MALSKEHKWDEYRLSERGERYVSMEQPMSFFSEFKLKSYDHVTHREGTIDLATSDNKIVSDLVVSKLSQHFQLKEEDTRYFPFTGSPSFRKAIAGFFERFMKPKDHLDAENIVVTNGAAALGQSLACVLCDPGDGILLPTPYYYGFDADFTLQPEVVCYPVHLSSQVGEGETGPFQLSVSKLEEALEKAKQENVRIRALVLCNPHNPLGTVYSNEAVQQCLEFAQRHCLHVISDEIYMLTNYKGCPWSSVLSVEKVIDPKLLHVMWGFSKDFGLAGFRVGVLFSRNPGVIEAIKAMSYYHAVPPVIQNALEGLISDEAWLDFVYIPALHDRLRKCLATVSDGLNRLNIPIVQPSAGLFVWANFSSYMQPLTFDTEKLFMSVLINHGILLCPGSFFSSSEPGWFRVVIASDTSVLKTAIERVKTALAALPKYVMAPHDNIVSTASRKEPSLEELVRDLKVQIGESDWLRENTSEKWIAENPQLAEEFMNAKGDLT